MGVVLWNQAQACGCPAFSNRPTTHTQHSAPTFPSSQKTMGESIFLSCGKCQENDVSGSNPDKALRAPSGFSHLSASLGGMSFQGLTLEFTFRCFGFKCESRCQFYKEACVVTSLGHPASGRRLGVGSPGHGQPPVVVPQLPCKPFLPAWAEVRGLGLSQPAVWMASASDCWSGDKVHRLTGPNPKKQVLKSWKDIHPRQFLTAPLTLVTSISFSPFSFFYCGKIHIT